MLCHLWADVQAWQGCGPSVGSGGGRLLPCGCPPSCPRPRPSARPFTLRPGTSSALLLRSLRITAAPGIHAVPGQTQARRGPSQRQASARPPSCTPAPASPMSKLGDTCDLHVPLLETTHSASSVRTWTSGEAMILPTAGGPEGQRNPAELRAWMGGEGTRR